MSPLCRCSRRLHRRSRARAKVSPRHTRHTVAPQGAVRRNIAIKIAVRTLASAAPSQRESVHAEIVRGF